MSSLSLRGLVVLLPTILIFACGSGGSSSNNGEDGGAMSLEEFVIEAETTHCEKSFECCTNAQRSDELGYDLESVDECPQAAGVAAAFSLAGFQGSVDAGRIELDQGVIDTCLEALAGLECSEYPYSLELADRPECEGALVPQVEAGGMCTTSADCQSGACAFETGGNEGTCEPLPREGDPCPSLNCAEGLYCESFDDICVAKEEAGASCFDDLACLSGNCVAGEQGDLTCASAESDVACQQ